MPVNECQFFERARGARFASREELFVLRRPDPTCVLLDDDFVAPFLHAERVKRKSRISVNSFNEIAT